jgi:glycosyltransferase involved in cell wall biosynthesis
MKVAWLNEHLLDWNGGIRYIYEITRRLRIEYVVDIFVTRASIANSSAFLQKGIIVTELSRFSGKQFIYWVLYPVFLIKNAIKLSSYLKSYDTVISSSPTCNLWCLLLRRKHIQVIFELNPWLYNKEYVSGLPFSKRFIIALAGPFARILDKLAYGYAIRTVVHSGFVKFQIKQIYGTRVPVDIAHSGVDSTFFHKIERSDLSDKYKNFNVILHVASYLSPIKGTRYAIQAMPVVLSSIPNALLLILNYYNNIPEQIELIRIAASLGVDKSVRFIGNTNDIDIPKYYSLAKVLLQPSLDENIHFPVIEAASCECPAIQFGGVLPPEDMVDGMTGYIVPKGFPSLFGIVAMSLINIDLWRKAMGVNARQYAVENFSWDECLSIYKGVI